ncbi:MAG: DUF899 family protein [Phycisphaerales bacterium]|nr:DUF899 family protein [Phycisphaerales bacterium]
MATTASDIQTLGMELMQARERYRKAIRDLPDEPVEDWTLHNTDGSPVKLSELFGDKTELLVVHNMGKHCNYCSLWADGFIGHADHIQERCAFVLCSNDDPKTSGDFAKERGWNYPVVSGKDSGFAEAMGYRTPDGQTMPGVSAFHKDDDGSIVRTGKDMFGPGDDFCPVWPFFELIKDGHADWQPRHGGKSSCCGGSSNCCND